MTVGLPGALLMMVTVGPGGLLPGPPAQPAMKVQVPRGGIRTPTQGLRG
jgi:hypothetical protein